MKRFTWLVLALFMVQSVSAQNFLKKLKDTVQDAAEDVLIDKAEDKTKEGTSKTVDEAFEEKSAQKDAAGAAEPEIEVQEEQEIEERKEETKSTKTTTTTTTTITTTTTQPQYSSTYKAPKPINMGPNSWIGEVDMRIETYKNGKLKDKSNILYAFQEWHTCLQPKSDDQKQDIRMIVNRKDGSMTNLINDNGKKQGIKMALPSSETLVTEIEEYQNDSNLKITKTSETAMKNGYRCTKYDVVSDDGFGYAWLTNDLTLTYANLYDSFNVSKKKQKGDDFMKTMYGVSGFMIESSFTDAKTKEESRMFVDRIKKGNPNPSYFDSSGYEIQDISQMMGQFGNFGQ